MLKKSKIINAELFLCSMEEEPGFGRIIIIIIIALVLIAMIAALWRFIKGAAP